MRAHRFPLTEGARKLLLATSSVLLFCGFVLYDLGDEWASRNLRASTFKRHFDPDILQHEYATAFLQLGKDAMVIGGLSIMNYMSYTGRPTVTSFLDLLACVWGGARFLYLSLLWAFKGNLAMITMALWSVATFGLYLMRKHPNEQIVVHAAGIGGLVCWTTLAFAHIAGVVPEWR